VQYLTNPILQKEMVSKLPTSLCMNWLRAADDSKPTIEDFSKWLIKEAKILAAGSSLSASSSTPTPKENPPEKKKGKCQVLATGDPAAEGKSPILYAKKCTSCGIDGHTLQDCLQ